MKNFYKVESWGISLLTVNRDTNISIQEFLFGEKLKAVFKTWENDVIKDYHHKTFNDYIKHIKRMGYKEIKEVEQIEDYKNEHGSFKQYKFNI